jgi:hypothetical protein
VVCSIAGASVLASEMFELEPWSDSITFNLLEGMKVNRRKGIEGKT